MDDYKKEIIELVRDRPLLWDPQNPEYHNKDQRKQVWEYIDSKCLPAGSWRTMSHLYVSSRSWKFDETLLYYSSIENVLCTTWSAFSSSFSDYLELLTWSEYLHQTNPWLWCVVLWCRAMAYGGRGISLWHGTCRQVMCRVPCAVYGGSALTTRARRSSL